MVLVRRGSREYFFKSIKLKKKKNNNQSVFLLREHWKYVRSDLSELVFKSDEVTNIVRQQFV